MRKILSILLLALSSCTPKSDLHSVEWRSGQNTEELKLLSTIKLSQETDLLSLGQTLRLKTQEFNGIPIDGSYVKEVSDKSGKVAVRALVSLNQDKLLTLPLDEFLNKRERIVKDLQGAFSIFRRHPPSQVSIVINHKRGFYQPLWHVVYTDAKGASWEARLNNHLQVQSVKRVGSQFQDTLAWVFPKGPQKSDLQEVLLRGLQTQPTLSNSRLLVSSQAEVKVSEIKGPLKFNPKDARFDQVQAFYFLDESLNWFERMLGVRVPFQLQAEVYVGAPEKTNSAFYYQGKIRLGTGDDEIYSHLSQDPSVVIHESVHALVDVVAGLPFEGEGGSINEGLADFFTAIQLNNPNMAEASYLKGPFRRSVVNAITLNDKNGGLYHDSGIISGTLWDLHERFGNVVGLRLAALTLNRLVPGSDFKDFGESLHLVMESELQNPGDLQAGKEILRRRGFQ
ncbi:MAG: hypothetical protein ACKOX6_03000 [Bdellovibrio sp.]